MKFIPYDYQTRMINKILVQSEIGLLLDCGLGKTVISLTAADILINDDFSVDRVLVITTKSARLTWVQEVKRWDHLSHLRVAVVEGTPAQRERILRESRVDVFIINRDLTKWISDFYMKEQAGPKRVTGHGRVKVPDMLIIDELSSYKSAKTARFKALRRIRPLFKRVVGLTGTPNPNGYDDLWSQMYLLDQGEALLPTLRAYHEAYFHPGRGNGHIVYEWIPDKGAPELIQKRMEGLCVSMRAEDYLTLPPLIEDDIPVELSPDEMEKYKALERDKILSLTDDDNKNNSGSISTFQAATLAIKLMQLSGGSVYTDDGSVAEFHSAKLDALEDLLESVGEGEPIMVMYAYKHELDRIYDRFKDYSPRLIDGEKDVDDWNAGKIRLLLCHPQSVAHGMNLQYGPGHRIVWYTLTNSLELYAQANHRLYRQGQTRPVFIHRLIAHGTIDGAVARRLTQKDQTQQELMDYLSEKMNGLKRGGIK